jgi:hypothetical protein
MGKLTAIKVKNAKPGRGADGKPTNARLSDGSGLSLLVKPNGAKSWVLRVQVNGKSRDVGLGAVDVEGIRAGAFGDDDPLADLPLMQRTMLTLAEAREKAAALRKLAKAGADPVTERDRERKVMPTFAEAVTAAHDALKSGWSDKTAKAFKASLEEHAVPKIGALRVDAIGASEIVLMLALSPRRGAGGPMPYPMHAKCALAFPSKRQARTLPPCRLLICPPSWLTSWLGKAAPAAWRCCSLS